MFLDGKTHVLVCNLNPTHLVLMDKIAVIATGITNAVCITQNSASKIQQAEKVIPKADM